MADDRAKTRRLNLLFLAVLAVLVAVSLCVSTGYNYTVYSPLDVVGCYASWFQIALTSVADPASLSQVQLDVYARYPMYFDVINSVGSVLRYLVCGAFLALAGMLYQNAFRNPIAAPTMLGVSSGVNAGLLVLVMCFGAQAVAMPGYYYLAAFVGGVAALLLVLLGGKAVSGRGSFNVVNMLLIGTIVTQLVNVVIRYVQANFLDETAWLVYYNLQAAAVLDSAYTYLTLLVCGVVGIVPIVALRFRLNLVSFSDEETRLLGVDPTKLRVVALLCGSLLVLAAQVNAGQVAMVSLVIPFVVRAVFGCEFRRQLVGNVLVGAILLLACGDLVSILSFGSFNITLGSVVSVVALPLFVWMIAVRQRGWE